MFKRGDIIELNMDRRINSPNSGPYQRLVKHGKTYVVKLCVDDMVKIEGIPNESFYSSRFKLYKKKAKISYATKNW